MLLYCSFFFPPGAIKSPSDHDCFGLMYMYVCVCFVLLSLLLALRLLLLAVTSSTVASTAAKVMPWEWIYHIGPIGQQEDLDKCARRCKL